jgi:hypothetical protein
MLANTQFRTVFLSVLPKNVKRVFRTPGYKWQDNIQVDLEEIGLECEE